MPDMGLGYGLGKQTTVYKRKFRWLFRIPDISIDGVRALPPSRAARPSVSFKEIEIQHLHETLYRPGKPEFKSFNLTLYDINCGRHPVFDWLNSLYEPEFGEYKYVINTNRPFLKEASLDMLDGCGNCMEKWIFEGVWPQTIDFQDLDMGSSEVVMVDLTIRFDRAYWVECD